MNLSQTILLCKELAESALRLRAVLAEEGLSASLRALDAADAGARLQRVCEVLAMASPVPQAVDAAFAAYEQLLDSLFAFKEAFDAELAARPVAHTLMERAQKRDNIPREAAWRKTRLGQVQQQAYGFIREAGMRAAPVGKWLGRAARD